MSLASPRTISFKCQNRRQSYGKQNNTTACRRGWQNTQTKTMNLMIRRASCTSIYNKVWPDVTICLISGQIRLSTHIDSAIITTTSPLPQIFHWFPRNANALGKHLGIHQSRPSRLLVHSFWFHRAKMITAIIIIIVLICCCSTICMCAVCRALGGRASSHGGRLSITTDLRRSRRQMEWKVLLDELTVVTNVYLVNGSERWMRNPVYYACHIAEHW